MRFARSRCFLAATFLVGLAALGATLRAQTEGGSCAACNFSWGPREGGNTGECYPSPAHLTGSPYKWVCLGAIGNQVCRTEPGGDACSPCVCVSPTDRAWWACVETREPDCTPRLTCVHIVCPGGTRIVLVQSLCVWAHDEQLVCNWP